MTPCQVLLGRYRLDQLIGSGGMSVVWSARDLVLRRDVAVKMLAEPVGGRTGDAIRAEALVAARLAHPHVATVFDFGEFTDDAGARASYLVMERLPGRTLASLARTEPVAPDVALRACAQVADALAAVHDLGVVHRDIKPGNVMLTATGAKVFDFGIAAPVGSPEPVGSVLGTVGYLAPERIAGCPVSAASDVYSLGLMLYRLLTHEWPWPPGPTERTAHLFLKPAELPPIAGVPPAVGSLYRRCLAKDPRHRPSAREVAAILTAAAASPATEVVPISAVTPLSMADGRATASHTVGPSLDAGTKGPVLDSGVDSTAGSHRGWGLEVDPDPTAAVGSRCSGISGRSRPAARSGRSGRSRLSGVARADAVLSSLGDRMSANGRRRAGGRSPDRKRPARRRVSWVVGAAIMVGLLFMGYLAGTRSAPVSPSPVPADAPLAVPLPAELASAAGAGSARHTALAAQTSDAPPTGTAAPRGSHRRGARAHGPQPPAFRPHPRDHRGKLSSPVQLTAVFMGYRRP